MTCARHTSGLLCAWCDMSQQAGQGLLDSADSAALATNTGVRSFEYANKKSEPGAEGSSPRASAWLFLAVALSCFSPILFGYSIAFTSSTQATIEGDKTPDGVSPPGYLVRLTVSEMSGYASILNVGCIIGAFSGAFLSDRLGRRTTLVLTALPHFVAWFGTGITGTFESFTELMILRVILGWAVGVGSAVTPTYIGEIATTGLRGALGAANQLSVTCGIFLVNFLGAYVCTVEHQGHIFTQWRTLSFAGAGISVLLLLVAAAPESPLWLAKKGKAQRAKAALERLRSGSSAEELEEIMTASTNPTSADAPTQNSKSLFQYSRSLIVGIGLLFFQQFSGVNAIIFFAGSICSSAGLDGNTAAMAIMAIQVFLTGISCLLMDRAGRRVLLLFASMSMAIGHIILAYYFLARDDERLIAPPMLALVALGIFILGFSLGMGPIPWLLLAEIFPTEVRGNASSLATAVNWLCSYLVTLSFLKVQEAISPQGTFLLFSVVCLLCFVFVMILVPETKGKTVDEVLRSLKAPAVSIRTVMRTE